MEKDYMEEKINEDTIKYRKKIIKSLLPVFLLAIGLIAMTFLLFGLGLSPIQETSKETLPAIINEQITTGKTNEELPLSQLLRQEYYKEEWGVNRENYELIKKGAEYLKVSQKEYLGILNLNSKEEIFEEIPEAPEDFGEINYLMQNGKYFSLEKLSDDYWRQPEFYPSWKNSMVFWTEPDPRYWYPHGFGAYPRKQETMTNANEDFYAIVYLHNSGGVQTWQGVKLDVTNNARDYFDITITPNEFLLDPMFPKISYNWVYEIEIRGKAKPSTVKGEYNVRIDATAPSKENENKWREKYKTHYFNASNAPLKGSKELILLTVKVI